MNIENEVFKRSIVKVNKLKKYGFKMENDIYKYSVSFFNNTFRANIFIKNDGNVSGKIFDLQSNEEYLNIRVINNSGEFVNKVREEYKSILVDIKNKCFENKYFISAQANKIAKYVSDKYNNFPEFLWEKDEGSAVFRKKDSKKWYGVIMSIDRSKIMNSKGEIEVLDVKANESDIIDLLKKAGFYKAYHMNKKKWITISLDDTISDNIIFKLIDDSYNLVK